MYKIIRNLELVQKPTQGWDKNPPTLTETTIGDDVERIRRSRNDFVHNVITNVSDVELNNRFSLFIDIASRLEVYMNKHNREYVSRIEDVKTRCLDPETEQLYIQQLDTLIERETLIHSDITAVSNCVDELRQQNELEISGLNTKVATLQTEQEETIPKNRRDQINKDIEKWKIKDNKFIPTRASAYVSSHLIKQNCITLTGSPGVGKTFVARHIALEFQLQGYMIIPIEIPRDIMDFYSPGIRTLFLIDDVCGTYIVNQRTLEHWQQMLPKLEQILADKCIKIISTCRLQVYKDDKFSSLEPFKIFECNLNSKEMCLTQSEKTKMKEKYFGNKNFIDTAPSSDFFPLLCSLQWLPKKDESDVYLLYESPFKFYKEELDNLNSYGDEGRQKICSLVLCVLFNNHLEEKWFEGRITDEQRQVLDDVYMAFRLNTGTPKTQLMDALDTLDGSLVCKRNAAYSAIHGKIFDFLAHYFGGRIMRCLIDHSDSYFINERFQWKTTRKLHTTDIAFAIELTNETSKLYFDRLVKDWSEGKVTVVINNSNMKDDSFRDHFIFHLMKLEKTKQLQLANTQDTLDKREWGTSGSYAMINACFLGYIDIVRWLLGVAVSVNQCRDDGNTSLIMASYNGHMNIVSLLLEGNHSINMCNKKGVTPLFIAIEKGYTEIVETLLKNNADVNNADVKGVTALFIAIEKGYTEIVEALLKNNADVNLNLINIKGWLSPLLQAAKLGHNGIVKQLLQKNPDVDFHDRDGFTPLLIACQNNNTEIIRLLLENKANVNMKTYTGASAIILASSNGNMEILRLLLESNADTNARLHTKNLISSKAMIRSMTELENLKQYIFNLVLTKGVPSVQKYARVKSKDYIFDVMAGSSALHIACCFGHSEIVECLLKYKASVNLTKEDGTTPLFHACKLGLDDIVCLLLDNGADIRLCRYDGKSPLAIAKENCHKYIEMKLRKHSKKTKA
ncbi:uncharacterized protein LOC143075884 [Mytilus galloprovincialis]|uniref:uncharacterized protein LOC143075884 n=1 Tax=Mytilus galloprovincialis TaxID=29158 RepID=UPI003F7BF202